MKKLNAFKVGAFPAWNYERSYENEERKLQDWVNRRAKLEWERRYKPEEYPKDEPLLFEEAFAKGCK